jgi:hypothetical protein
MPISVVNITQVPLDGASPLVITIPAVTPGNRLVVTGEFLTAASVAAGSNSLTARLANNFDGDNNYYIWDSGPITDEPTSVTITYTGTGFMGGGFVYELSGVDETNPRGTPQVALSFGPTLSFTTAEDNALILGQLVSASESVAPSGGYVRFPASGDEYHLAVYNEDVGSAGSKTYPTTSAGTWWAIMGIPYYPAEGGGPATRRQRMTLLGVG